MGLRPSRIERIVAADLCTGCGACASLAPSALEMHHAKSGFARPRRIGALTRSEDKAIAAICPGRSQSAPPPADKTHRLWGPYTSLSQGWAKDAELRHAGPSAAVPFWPARHWVRVWSTRRWRQVCSTQSRWTSRRLRPCSPDRCAAALSFWAVWRAVFWQAHRSRNTALWASGYAQGRLG